MNDTRDHSNNADRNENRESISFAWMWLWLLLITAATMYAYLEMTTLTGALLSGVPWFSEVPKRIAGSSGGQILLVAAWSLFWWRVVKVVVFLGSPLPFGMRVSWGRQDSGVGGRITHTVHIGDHDAYGSSYQGRFWYGAVFRAHPRSDKLIRSRLEHLVLALPFDRVLIVGEGRFMVAKKSHQERAKIHRQFADRYSKTKDAISPDRFRKDVAGHLKGAAKSLKAVEDYFEERRIIAALETEGETTTSMTSDEQQAIFAIGKKLSLNNTRSTSYTTTSGDELLLRLRKRGLVKGLRNLVRYLGGNSGYMHVELTTEGRRVYDEVERKLDKN